MTAFDLFRTTSEGTEWVATFLSVDEAKSNAEIFAAQVPGEYFVVDQVSATNCLNWALQSGVFTSINHVQRVTKTAPRVLNRPHSQLRSFPAKQKGGKGWINNPFRTSVSPNVNALRF